MKLKRNIKGQALTEFALIFPLMFALVGGAIDWGLTFLVSHVVQNAVQDGARLAATQGSVVEADVEAAVQSRIPDIPLFSAFRDPANIIVTPPNLADCPNAVHGPGYLGTRLHEAGRRCPHPA